jgi:protein TonB
MSVVAKAQDAKTDEFLYPTETIPEFPGGQSALTKFLFSNLRGLKKGESDCGGGGKVHVKFIVDENGDVQQPVVVKGLCPAFDEEVLRVVRLLPRFVPSKQDGKPVSVYFNLPLMVTLK